MKINYILYLFICTTQYIDASQTPDVNAINVLVCMKRKIVHIDTETKAKKNRLHVTDRSKENHTVIEIPTIEALRTRFKKNGYHDLLEQTTILNELKNMQPTPAKIYTTVDEICNEYYQHRDCNTFLTKLYHKDQIVRIILRDYPKLITELENQGKIL
ncbi:MAG: hypothetical protein Q8Q60_03465 [Candidatus Chromulinivorax sp.]|nr:hypothetical protein [Candidatus Chromulinivorax sp.]